jgi:hypothetical protein
MDRGHNGEIMEDMKSGELNLLYGLAGVQLQVVPLPTPPEIYNSFVEKNSHVFH